MAQPQLRPQAYRQPHPKTDATFNNSSNAPGAGATPPQISRPPSLSRHASPTRSHSNTDASDRATAALVRRVLCPHVHAGSTEPRPIDELLPPLTSSNDIDLQLYAIIAIIVKELVYSWYGKITPDQAFVEEVVRIVAHCTRALEGRLRTVDLEALVFDEIPELIESHVLAYRISHPPIPSPLNIDPHIVYHNLHPHPALSPIPTTTKESTIVDQSKNEVAYRQLLVQGALAVLLPTEDLENVFLTTLVADVIGEMILGNAIGGKASEGWFIWSSIVKIVDVIQARLDPTRIRKASGEHESHTRSRLENFGLLSETGRGQSTEKAVSIPPSKDVLRSLDSKLFWRILQYGYLTFLTLRFVILGLVATFSQSRQPLSSGLKRKTKIADGVETPPIAKIVEPPTPPRPLLSFRVFSLISVLLNVPLRMPWLSGSLGLVQHQLMHGALKVGATDGLLNQYIHHLLTTHLDPAALLPALLSTLRTTFFRNSSLPLPSSPPPSPAQQKALKRACARSLVSLFPVPILRRFFGIVGEMGTADAAAAGNRDGGDVAREEEEAVLREIEKELEVWGDGYLNRHVAYAVLELVV
ncbi:hypothetical protein MMC29_005125, partial [Sticta canariensis]|nr:hypothetical protein [Sticta canariensis]